jgi:hypothetical protein
MRRLVKGVKMKTILVIVVVISILLGAVGALAFGVVQHKEDAAETVLKAVVWWVLGSWPEVGDFKLDLKGHRIEVKDLKVRNPEGFPPEEKWMIQVPEISVTYDPASIAQKKLLLKEFIVVVKEVTIVRNKNKEVNIDTLKIVRDRRKKSEEREEVPEKVPSGKERAKFSFKIDRLHLELPWVVYKDYAQGKWPFIQENRVIFNETFQNVTDLDELRREVIARTIAGRAVNAFAEYQWGLFAPASPRFISPQAKEGTRIMEELMRILFPFDANPQNGKKDRAQSRGGYRKVR